MDDAVKQRLITLLAAGIAYALSHFVVSRFVDIPERRGLRDDVLEALIKGGTSALSTVLAAVIVRRIFR
ncbi:hypothetical protein E0L93_08985 [Rubrobacter taiwanensis]|jgi:hypothetical protein|uniref:Uncharacterized protein n=1 Tax=Rubrobacter taiwanensis TaxID=185139 RepID=A0A4R1BHY5_9ACTN|nr:hypothetical protein [Rubrobacter taiwanensis]TCJ16841.1 hypothetical protein E0L93_08985 [Rubrobacter taiwanensis]